MFNKDLKLRLDSAESQIRELEFKFLQLQGEFQKFKIGKISSDNFKFISPLGDKFMFTFDMPDGSKNGGLCNSLDKLCDAVAMVRELNGVNLIIRDETFLMKVTSTRAHDHGN